MIYKAPKYTENFKCIASDCRDSCCIGWEIYADEEALKKYENGSGALYEDIRRSLSEDGCFRLTESGRCPHLLESGLCRIICEAGEDALCDICREHPRFYNYYGGICEWGVSLACESAARLILESEDAHSYTEEMREEDADSEVDEALFSLFFAQREKMQECILDNEITLEKKLFILEEHGKQLQNFIENSDISKYIFTFCDKNDEFGSFFTEERIEGYKQILLDLDPLSPSWKTRCEHLHAPKMTREKEMMLSRILSYFIYRYFLTYAIEGDVTAPIGLAVFATAAIAALCESEGRQTLFEIAEAAKDFSKEIEYSEENRDAVLDAFSAFSAEGF